VTSVAFEGVRPGSVRAWVIAARPPTLSAALVPVAVGTACAAVEGSLKPGPALAALAGALLLQVAANFANDVFDYEKGADTEERLGPVRAAQAGLLTPGELRAGMAVVFALALAIGVYLTSVAGIAIVAIGLASIASAIAYTGGPYPLGYHGLGDVFVLAFFGFVAVTGTAFVQAGYVPSLAWAAAVPVGAIATAVLVVNNVRDRDTDVKAGKRTLPVRFGRRAGIAEYGALLTASYLVPAALAATRFLSPWVLLPVLSLPLAVRLIRRVASDTGRALNASLVGTARLLLVHAVLFAIGIAASALAR
jgi:1,4-dihydroxy-2-naphthoate polyprenyltransferase